MTETPVENFVSYAHHGRYVYCYESEVADNEPTTETSVRVVGPDSPLLHGDVHKGAFKVSLDRQATFQLQIASEEAFWMKVFVQWYVDTGAPALTEMGFDLLGPTLAIQASEVGTYHQIDRTLRGEDVPEGATHFAPVLRFYQNDPEGPPPPPVLDEVSYSEYVMSKGPLARWRMGEASGTTMVDSSHNNRNGTYIGTVTLGQPGMLEGEDDTAADFAGGHAEVADASWMDQTAFTVAAWITPDSVSGSKAIMTHSDWQVSPASAGRSWHMILTNAKLDFGLSFTDGTYHTGGEGPDLVAGETRHVCCSWDGTTARTYLDGVQVWSSTTWAGKTLRTSSKPLAIGAGMASAGAIEKFDGLIDEAEFYGKALDPSEVAELYERGTVGGYSAAGFNVRVLGSFNLASDLDADLSAGGQTINFDDPNINGYVGPWVRHTGTTNASAFTLTVHDTTGGGNVTYSYPGDPKIQLESPYNTTGYRWRIDDRNGDGDRNDMWIEMQPIGEQGTPLPDPIQPGAPLAAGHHIYFDCIYIPENGLPVAGERYLDGDQPRVGDQPRGKWEGDPRNSTSIWDDTPENLVGVTLDEELTVPEAGA